MADPTQSIICCVVEFIVHTRTVWSIKKLFMSFGQYSDQYLTNIYAEEVYFSKWWEKLHLTQVKF